MNDGVINISSFTNDPLGRFLHYYDPTPKMTQDGKGFNMFAGFYLDVATDDSNGRFLRAKTREDLKAKRDYNWSSVTTMETQLESLLTHVIRSKAMVYKLVVSSKGEIVWSEPDHALSTQEKRWLRVVRKVVRRLRNDHE